MILGNVTSAQGVDGRVYREREATRSRVRGALRLDLDATARGASLRGATLETRRGETVTLTYCVVCDRYGHGYFVLTA